MVDLPVRGRSWRSTTGPNQKFVFLESSRSTRPTNSTARPVQRTHWRALGARLRHGRNESFGRRRRWGMLSRRGTRGGNKRRGRPARSCQTLGHGCCWLVSGKAGADRGSSYFRCKKCCTSVETHDATRTCDTRVHQTTAIAQLLILGRSPFRPYQSALKSTITSTRGEPASFQDGAQVPGLRVLKVYDRATLT